MLLLEIFKDQTNTVKLASVLASLGSRVLSRRQTNLA